MRRKRASESSNKEGESMIRQKKVSNRKTPREGKSWQAEKADLEQAADLNEVRWSYGREDREVVEEVRKERNECVGLACTVFPLEKNICSGGRGGGGVVGVGGH